MPWVKIDDQFHSNPKVVAAGSEAVALYIVALSWSGAYLTDGFIPAGQVRRLALSDNYEEATERLIDVGLWHTVEGGYQINDYLEYNPSGAEIKAKRKAAAKRQAEYRERQQTEEGDDDRDGEDDNVESNDVSNAVTNGVSNAVTNTTSRTRPRPPKEEKRHGDADASPPEPESERKPSAKDTIRGELEQHFADKTGLPKPKADTARQKREAGTLWWGPLREIAELCNWDGELAARLIDATLAHLNGQVTIASPKSIIKTAKAVYTGNAPGAPQFARAGPSEPEMELVEDPDHPGKYLAREVTA